MRGFAFFKVIYLFLETEEGRERRRETSMCGRLSSTPYRGPGPQPSMCPHWELNQRPFGSQACAQSTEPHQPGLIYVLKRALLVLCGAQRVARLPMAVASVGLQGGQWKWRQARQRAPGFSSPSLVFSIVTKLIFSIVTGLCNHHHKFQKVSLLPKRDIIPIGSHFPFPPSPPPGDQ